MRILTSFSALTLFLLASNAASAQSISISLRGTGSLPSGAFGSISTPQSQPAAGGGGNISENVLFEGAKNGFGYGLDVVVSLGMLGVYAGFDKIKFDCEPDVCSSQGEYDLAGASVGLRVAPSVLSRLQPYAKAGVTFNSLKGSYGGASGTKFTTDRAPGYEVGAGGNISLGGIFAITPQVRYVGQNLGLKLRNLGMTEGSTDDVNYWTFDLGLSVVSPFGRR